jgi:hypothetical protein
MLLLRAVFLEFLLGVHVIGAAVLFRRLFPRESPWFGFVVPILVFLAILNFVEHFIALPNLGWLLPMTLGGLTWVIVKPGYSWEGLKFPAILFIVTFTFVFGLKCIAPVISNATEGVSNLTRVLNYCLGGTLPQIDCFLPPYDYGIYYSFQHYGAAILKRLFSTDLGTAYNVSYAFLLAWVCLAGAGVAHSISGKIWIAVATMVVLLAGWTGSFPLFIFFTSHGTDYELSTNLNADWNNPDHNPLSWICAHDKYHPCLLLQAPLINLYWSEFHSTLGGHFVTIASLLASSEIFKFRRSNWPWICLVALPMVIIITSAWFFFIVFFLCGSSLALALLAGRRPENWKFVGAASAVAVVLFWPSVYSVIGISSPEQFQRTQPEDHTPFWMFIIQWWPVFLPWLFLCFIWNKLDLNGRWILIALPVLFTGIEFVTFGDRKLTTEKMWAGTYGAGLVTLLPIIFKRKGIPFRLLSAIIIFVSPICLGMALDDYYPNPLLEQDFAHLQGNDWILGDPQKKRLLQVLRRFHGETILPGRSYWNYSQSPAVVDFSENRCFVAYTHHEFHCGRGAEAEYRNKENNDFYDGRVANPLPFLRANNIAAVLIWPEDNISDQLLQQFQGQLGSEFFYVDCKMDGPNNAGVFMRQSDLEGSPIRHDSTEGIGNIPP